MENINGQKSSRSQGVTSSSLDWVDDFMHSRIGKTHHSASDGSDALQKQYSVLMHHFSCRLAWKGAFLCVENA